jgi:hypothetical protein
MTKYQIVYVRPLYDDRDSVYGWRYEREANAYESPALPGKLAEIYNEICDPAYAFVMPYGADVHRHDKAVWRPAFDEGDRFDDPYGDGVPF